MAGSVNSIAAAVLMVMWEISAKSDCNAQTTLIALGVANVI